MIAIVSFIVRKFPGASRLDVGSIYARVSMKLIIDRFMALHKYISNNEKQELIDNPT